MLLAIFPFGQVRTLPVGRGKLQGDAAERLDVRNGKTAEQLGAVVDVEQAVGSPFKRFYPCAAVAGRFGNRGYQHSGNGYGVVLVLLLLGAHIRNGQLHVGNGYCGNGFAQVDG